MHGIALWIRGLSILIIGFVMLGVGEAQSSRTKNETARAMLNESVRLLGGVEAWRSVKTSKLEGIGHQYWLEVPERPEGPWPIQYFQFDEIRRLDQKEFRRNYTQRWNQIPEWSPSLTILYTNGLGFYERGERKTPAPAALVESFSEWMAIAPERILVSALATKDLSLLPDEKMLGSVHHVVQYKNDRRVTRLFINDRTNALDAIELEEDHPGSPFWNVWGDVKTTVVFSSWTEEDSKLVFPRQWHIEKNGLPYQEWTITKVTWNVEAQSDSFTVSDSLRMSASASSVSTLPDNVPLSWRAKQPITEIAPGIVKISSGFDVALVKQDDGIVVIEAPTSNGFSKKVIEEADRRFPGVRLKALVATDQFVAHNAGIREYVARGVPLYTLDLNEKFVRQLLYSPHHLRPDSLQRSKRAPVVHPIDKRTTLGSGTNVMNLIPVNTPSGERLLMIYFPNHKLLYGSDLFQKIPNGQFFTKQTVTELVHAVRREKLDVRTVFMAHLGALDWKEVEEAAK